MTSSNRSIEAFEAEAHFCSLLEAVAQGERITITRHGKPVAHLVPVEPLRPSSEEVIQRLRELREKQTLGADLNWKMSRDSGRKR